MVNSVLTTYHLFNIICINLPEGGSKMNVRMLKAKRVERNLRQKDLARLLIFNIKFTQNGVKSINK